MPVPAVDADKRGDAYKKVKPVDGIDEQGLVPDPQVMHVLFARLMASPFVTNRPTNIKPTRTPLSTHLHL